RRARPVDERPELGGVERLREGHRAAGVERRLDRAPGVAVEEGRDGEEHVVGGQAERLDEVPAADAGRAVAEEYAFRRSGRARGVEERGGVAGTEDDAGRRLGAALDQRAER